MADEVLLRHHRRYFQTVVRYLPEPYVSMDTNRLTVLHFAVHGLAILEALELLDREAAIRWVYSMQLRSGGFRGGSFLGSTDGSSAAATYDQMHIAMTYCALLILKTLGDDLGGVDKAGLLAKMRGMQTPEGSFRALEMPSESDMRFLYCACAISHVLDDWTAIDIDRATSFVRRSRGYDGGFGLHPWQESHGGATYCALASLVLMGQVDDVLDRDGLDLLLEWCVSRQKRGFNGRGNKDEDTCYSFWVGATLETTTALANQVAGVTEADAMDVTTLADRELVWTFMKLCQNSMFGGFGKLPGAPPDVLHSYYGCCWLSMAQQNACNDSAAEQAAQAEEAPSNPAQPPSFLNFAKGRPFRLSPLDLALGVPVVRTTREDVPS